MGLASDIAAMGRAAGAVAVGFAPAGEVDPHHWHEFQSFISRGAHYSMRWLENYPEIRRNPLLLFTPPATQGTVISFAFPYWHRDVNPLFARYAQGTDYHRELRGLLKPIARHITETTSMRCRICVDSAPILERYWAQRAGIGCILRNRCLYVPGAGTFVFLAEIITEAVITPDTPVHNLPDSPCDTCDRCLRACPHGALRADAGFDSSRCQSCLTIEHPGPLPYPVMGPAVYGCDICQNACPVNTAPAMGMDCFAPSAAMASLTRSRLSSLSEDEYKALFARSAVSRCTLTMLLRNIANSQNTSI